MMGALRGGKAVTKTPKLIFRALSGFFAESNDRPPSSGCLPDDIWFAQQGIHLSFPLLLGDGSGGCRRTGLCSGGNPTGRDMSEGGCPAEPPSLRLAGIRQKSADHHIAEQSGHPYPVLVPPSTPVNHP